MPASPEEKAGRREFHVGGADPAELVRYEARPGHNLFEYLALPVESVRVVLGPGLVVDEPVRRQPRPLPFACILVGLELDQEEREAAFLGRRLALADEIVGPRMLACGVVEDHDIPPFGVEDIVRQQRKQEHSARSPAGELDYVRELRMVLVQVEELVLSLGIVGLRRSA